LNGVVFYDASARAIFQYIAGGKENAALATYLSLSQRLQEHDATAEALVQSAVRASDSFGRLLELLKAELEGMRMDETESVQ
jgi:hypothetical protein